MSHKLIYFIEPSPFPIMQKCIYCLLSRKQNNHLLKVSNKPYNFFSFDLLSDIKAVSRNIDHKPK